MQMPATVRIARRRLALGALVVAAALAALGIGSLTSASPARGQDRQVTPKALALHDSMRALWESHGTWTERAIVDFVGDLPDTQVAVDRLLRNQTEIGNAVKPFYGRKAGNRLTTLLKGHINAAVALLQPAKSGDSDATAKAKAAFYANGGQVARFLHAANPRHWSLQAMKRMMRIHLDQVVGLAVDQLQGRYAAAVRLYDVYIGHILDMADMLSTGIMQQFPARFSS
jgi:hypothetical protein